MLKIDLNVIRGKKRFQYDLSLPPESLTVIVGPSGSGKSTLLLALAGLIPSEGTCSFRDEYFHKMVPEKRPLSLLFQDYNLFDHLTVFQNTALAFNTSPHKISFEEKREVENILESMSIWDECSSYPSHLSGGQRQRASLARALLRKKPILCLDEPFNNLDPGLRRELHSLTLKIHRDRKLTSLFISHHPEEAAQISDKMIFVGLDGLICMGSPREILESSNPHIKHYLKGKNS